MKKQIIILLTLLCTGLIVNAQKEYRLAKASGHLKLNLSGAIVEGYDGKEIIFSSTNNTDVEVDERAKGLVAIASSGYSDNTGLGINVKESGQEIIVNNIFKSNSDVLTIKVPQGIKVSFTNNSSQSYETITIRNIKGEIEVSTLYNTIKLENNSGPMNINSINGPIEAIFNTGIKGPISIISIYEYVDITLPVATKGNVELSTKYGKLYAAKEFNIDIDTSKVEKKSNTPATTNLTGTNSIIINNTAGTQINRNNTTTTTSISSSGVGAITIGYAFNIGEKIKGKLNGGGIDLIFQSTNNNVYLRQK